jgi:hypothetical protein
MDSQRVSGVDGRYTGRDTGSIITTGGTERMLDQVTMIDQPKINMYNEYAKRMTKLVLLNLIEYGEKRQYFIKDKAGKYSTVEVAFDDIDIDTVFGYEMDISSILPKNKQRIEQQAMVLLEKQAQYKSAGMEVEWITPEEALMMMNLPYAEMMLERMGIERHENFIETVSQIVYQYGTLTQNGMSPEEALYATANTLQQAKTPMEQGQAPAVPFLPGQM